MRLALEHLLCFLLIVFPDSDPFIRIRIRRRRRGCSAVDCEFSDWSDWSPCSCSDAKSYRYRTETKPKSCGGTCNSNNVQDVKNCCCPKKFADATKKVYAYAQLLFYPLYSCVMSTWNHWSSCSRSCGKGYRYRTRTVARYETCGGSCPDEKSQWTPCDDGCCPAHCTVTQWGPWSVYCPCGSTTMQHRSRDVASPSSCGGAACPSLSESRRKTCDCCRQDCHWTWGSWDSCSNDCGRGSQRRYTEIVQSPSCGGSACPFNSQTKSCSQYTPRDCQVSRLFRFRFPPRVFVFLDERLVFVRCL